MNGIGSNEFGRDVWVIRVMEAINRLFALLGYKTESDREKALARFLAWLAFVEAYVGSQDSEVRATWTEAALRALSNVNRLTTTSAAEEAASLADGLIAQQLRRFPPRPHDTGRVLDVEFVAADEWQRATGCATSEDAEAQRERTGNALQKAVQEAIDRDAKLAERDADLLKYAAEIDRLRQEVETRNEIIDGIVDDISPGVDRAKVDQQEDVRRADDALSDTKTLLAKILNVEPSHPLLTLAQGVAEMVAGRTRAAETLAEREAAKLRAELQTTLRELATARETLNTVQHELDDCRGTKEFYRGKLAEKEEERAAAVKAKEEAEQNFLLEKSRHSDTIGHLERLRKVAFVPKDKPSKVEEGQRWAVLHTVKATLDRPDFFAVDTDVQRLDGAAILRLPHWIYLGHSS